MPQRCVGIAASVLVGYLITGCSCTRRPEWDSGLRETEPMSTSARGGSAANGEGDAAVGASGAGMAGGVGDSGSGGGGSGQGEGVGGAADGKGTGGAGAGDSGSSGDAADGAADGGGKSGGAAAGTQPGGQGGTADNASIPPAALPGRPRPKPLYDAKTAADVAERRLRQANSIRSDGDLGNAYAAALEAFEAVEPHAPTDDACKQLRGRAKRLLGDIAEKLNHETSPRAVPTYFQ